MDYQKTIEELKQYYADLLIIQYQKPKAIATIKALIEQALCNLLMLRIREECLNVDVSVGVNLDIIGKWVGIDRYFKGQKFDNEIWFALTDWNDNSQPTMLQGCFQDWNNPNDKDGRFLDYSLIISTSNKLNDDDFRLLIKLKIVKNSIVATAKNIDDSIYKIFKDTVYTVWGDSMNLTYYYNPSQYVIIKLAEEKGILPVPTGVKVEIKEDING